MAFRVLFGAVLGLLLAVPAQAGFITIDHFTNATTSDALGVRSVNGFVSFAPALSQVSMVSINSNTSQLFYSFIPAPLVVSPVFRINGRNNQTTVTETGELTVTAYYTNGSPGSFSLTQTLPAAQGGVNSNYIFDFTSLISPTAVITDLELDWTLPSGDTGGRELIIDFIDVEEVPEPATLALIGLASSGGGIAAFRRRRKAVAAKK